MCAGVCHVRLVVVLSVIVSFGYAQDVEFEFEFEFNDEKRSAE